MGKEDKLFSGGKRREEASPSFGIVLDPRTKTALRQRCRTKNASSLRARVTMCGSLLVKRKKMPWEMFAAGETRQIESGLTVLFKTSYLGASR